ncbi:MAG: hypothetical protein KTR26_07175 [Flammeovirgaceae bacterium]|nr:hypothetical protein [Flammeovirgaceae bacterium]
MFNLLKLSKYGYEKIYFHPISYYNFSRNIPAQQIYKVDTPEVTLMWHRVAN